MLRALVAAQERIDQGCRAAAAGGAAGPGGAAAGMRGAAEEEEEAGQPPHEREIAANRGCMEAMEAALSAAGLPQLAAAGRSGAAAAEALPGP